MSQRSGGSLLTTDPRASPLFPYPQMKTASGRFDSANLNFNNGLPSQMPTIMHDKETKLQTGFTCAQTHDKTIMNMVRGECGETV